MVRNHSSVMLVILIGIVICFVILGPALAFGQPLPDKIVPCSGPDCDFCKLAELAQNIVSVIIYLSVFLAAILFAWAGWNYLTNFGDEGKVKKAHSIFLNVFIGLVFVLGAWLIVDTVIKTLVGSTSQFGPWNALRCQGI